MENPESQSDESTQEDNAINEEENSEIDLDNHSVKRIPWKLVKKAKRIVIKIGTRALIREDRKF